MLLYTCLGLSLRLPSKRLLILQKKAVRIIAGVSPRTHTKPLFTDMKILTLKGIFQYSVGLFMYKFVKGMLPALFDNLFKYVNQVHAHFTRNSLDLVVPFSRTSRGQKKYFLYWPTHMEFAFS